MTTFSIEFPNSDLGVIPAYQIHGFSFTTRLTSMYAVSKVIFRDFTKAAFNKLKVGMDVNVIFGDTADTAIKYTNPMKVKSFTKSPAANDSVVDTMTLELISAWYYVSDVQTAHYFGSVGSITYQVLNNFFSDLGYKFDITTTTDNPKSRYQISKRPQAFLEWLIPKGLKDNYPLYFYTDHKGVIRLVGYNDFAVKQNFYLAQILGAENLHEASAKDYAISTLNLTAYDVSLNPSYSAAQSIHTVNHYHSATAYPQDTLLLSCESNGLTSNAKRNIQVATPSPVKIEISPWYECPYDARAEFLFENWRQMSQTFKVIASLPEFQLDDCSLGNLIRLELPFNAVQNPTTGEMLNFAEGGYIIDSLTFTWEKGKRSTIFEMFQIRF